MLTGGNVIDVIRTSNFLLHIQIVFKFFTSILNYKLPCHK